MRLNADGDFILVEWQMRKAHAEINTEHVLVDTIVSQNISFARTSNAYVVNVISADNQICAEVAENPQNYLVPHPSDCTKFYSCQSLGEDQGWVAHLMDCPESTGFDVNLRICNFIQSLPRCQSGIEVNP